jgi:hypothetical protein
MENWGVAHGHLHLFKRHPSVEAAYWVWQCEKIKVHGLMRNFILNEKLGWDAPDNPGTIVAMTEAEALALGETDDGANNGRFRAKGRPEDRKVLTNDWPYSIPNGMDGQISILDFFFVTRGPDAFSGGEGQTRRITSSGANFPSSTRSSYRPIFHESFAPAYGITFVTKVSMASRALRYPLFRPKLP